MAVLLILVVVVSYIYINQVKEGFNYSDERMSYEHFKTLSESSPDEYNEAFNILTKYIETKFKDRISIYEIINRLDKYQMSSDKKYLKWILNNGTEYLYEIKKGTLTPISKIRSKKSSKQIEDCMIELTRNDFDNILKYKLFGGIKDDESRKAAYDLLDKRINGKKEITNEMLSPLYENKAYNFYISLNDNTKKVNFVDASFFKNGSGKVLHEDAKTLFNTLSDYLLTEKLVTSDIKDPYFDFEIVHDNLTVLYDTIKDILNNTNSTKQYSIWVGTKNMMTIK